VIKIEIGQAERRNNWREHQAGKHGEYLYEHHDDGIDDKDIVADNKLNNAL
jgi:hypothetical protein